MPLFGSTANVRAQSSDPGAIGAGSLWSDTDAQRLLRRNDANTEWVEVGIGALGSANQHLAVNSGATAIEYINETVPESAEQSSTPVADDTEHATGTIARYYSYFTFPTTEKFYYITGIEWKNGLTAAGNCIVGADIVSAIPPVNDEMVTVAYSAEQSVGSVSSIKRNNAVTSLPIRGGTIVGLWIHYENSTHSLRAISISSRNQRRSFAYPTNAVIQLNIDTDWSTHTFESYLKVYFRGYG